MPWLRGRVRVAVFNATGAAVGLAVVALASEGWARSKADFVHLETTDYLHPRAGRLYVPGSEVYWTNWIDFWTVSRANRWGFLDRPPPRRVGKNERPREPSCRVAVVGDSFVAGREVPVSDKLHVRLEEMARSRLPTLRVSASAYGQPSTGQVNQLGFYDEFASKTAPDIVVLVFVLNDFVDNFADQPLWITAIRGDDGTFKLRPPSALLPGASSPEGLMQGSYILPILRAKARPLWRQSRTRRLIDYPPEELEHALDYTRFALDQWTARAQRDDFLLVALVSHTIGEWHFEQLEPLVSARNIPVVNQRSYIWRRNARYQDGRFAYDGHWNAQGHQWAAEALLEWLEQNQAACTDAPASAEASPAAPAVSLSAVRERD